MAKSRVSQQAQAAQLPNTENQICCQLAPEANCDSVDQNKFCLRPSSVCKTINKQGYGLLNHED